MVSLTPWRKPRPDPVMALSEAVNDMRQLREVAYAYASNNEILTERLAELELDLEDMGWERITGQMQREFSRQGLARAITLSRLMALKNPIVKRGMFVQLYYVWAQGVTVQSRIEEINEVVQEFLDDPDNRAEFSAHSSRIATDRELYVTGNLAFVLFTSPAGRVKVRSIPIEEIEDIILDPNDRRRPLYYKRRWQQAEMDEDGEMRTSEMCAYYPGWRHAMRNEGRLPDRIGKHPVIKDAPVYYVTTGGERDWKFGLPEDYAGFDWARAYKKFLEDFASVSDSLARFAWQITGAKSAREIASVKSRLGTAISGTNTVDTNPPPGAGSMFIGTNGKDLSPIRTSGATAGPSEARELKLMAEASAGLPDTFYGDTAQGSLATAKSLDRPTELKFRDRQALWTNILVDLCTYACLKAIDNLDGWDAVRDEEGDVLRLEGPNDKDGKPQRADITVTWPDILEHDKLAEVQAIVEGATMKGQKTQTMPPRLLFHLLAAALDVPDADEWIERIFGEDEGYDIPEPDPEPTDPAAMAAQAQQQQRTRQQVAEAMQTLRQFLEAEGK